MNFVTDLCFDKHEQKTSCVSLGYSLVLQGRILTVDVNIFERCLIPPLIHIFSYILNLSF